MTQKISKYTSALQERISNDRQEEGSPGPVISTSRISASSAFYLGPHVAPPLGQWPPRTSMLTEMH